MINGYKKFTVAVLTMVVISFNTFFGKDLDIDINATTEAIFALVGVGYMIAQAIHDVSKEKKS